MIISLYSKAPFKRKKQLRIIPIQQNTKQFSREMNGESVIIGEEKGEGGGEGCWDNDFSNVNWTLSWIWIFL